MTQIQYPWLSSNVEISYPFKPQVYPWYVASIFTDAYIVDGTNLRVDMEPINEPLRLVQFELTDASTAGFMQLQYISDGSLFFFDNTSPTTEYRVYDFGDWKVVAADNQEERKYVRLTLYTPNIPAYPFTLSLFIDGLEAVFVARVHEQNLPKVYSIEVTDADTGVAHVLSEDVEIRPGFNTSFTVENNEITSQSFDDSDNRTLTAVTMAASPGAGEGRRPVDCEEEAEALRQVNFLPPDEDGNVLLNMTGNLRSNLSYTGTGALVVRNEGVIDLDNDGAACCTCEEYGEEYENILAVQARAVDVAAAATAVNDESCEVTSDMEAELICRQQLDIRVLLVAKTGWIVNIMIVLNNNPPCDLNAPPVIVTLTSAACGGTCIADTDYKIVGDMGYLFNLGEDYVWRKFDITNPAAPVPTSEVVLGSSYMVVSYEVLIIDEANRGCDPGVTPQVAPEITVTAAGNWSGTVVSDSKTIELECPLRDPDPDDCEIVTDYPPAP